MDISHLKELKKESNLTNAEIAELSGIPFSTVNKIFSGATENPRYATLLAIEQVLTHKQKLPLYYDEHKQEPCLVHESPAPYCYTARRYDYSDIEKLSETTRAELIDGRLYLMSAPSRIHQFLVAELFFSIKSHIRQNRGACHVYTAPFAVRLFADDKTFVEPDIAVICNRNIMTEKGCDGAPDLIIEVVSPSNATHDYVTKLMKYQKAGVREYWIVNPEQERVSVINFENPDYTTDYAYTDTISSGVLPGLQITINEFMGEF